MRAILQKERELQAILDSEDATEPEKAEALRELEEITEFQKHHARRSTDNVTRTVASVRQAVKRLCQHLARAAAPHGQSTTYNFAQYIKLAILSGLYATHARTGMTPPRHPDFHSHPRCHVDLLTTCVSGEDQPPLTLEL